MAQENAYLTVTLTGRAPIRIKKENWPIIAGASAEDYDSEYYFQANRISKWALKVRRHADGRAIVYGTYSYSSNYLGERDYSVRGGELLPNSDDLPAAIQRVGRWMAEQEHSDGDEQRWASLINECIAALPAEELA